MKRVPAGPLVALVASIVPITGCDSGFELSELRQLAREAIRESTDSSTAQIQRWSGHRGELEAQARSVAQQHGLDPALVTAVIEIESSWDPRARSHKGARGLMQIMPETAREEYGLTDPEVLFEPAVNLRLGVSHLRELLERFCEPRLALWAWHAGSHRVDPLAGRITPDESRRFVRRVMVRYHKRRDAGFAETAELLPSPQCRSRERVARTSDGHRPEQLEPPLAADRPETPDPEITNAWASALRVRVGEPVELRIDATNGGGPAGAGEIAVTLLDHPPLELAYRSDLEAEFYPDGEPAGPSLGTRAGAPDPVVLVRADRWDAGAQHSLNLRLVPAETGTITLRYRLTLEDADGRLYRYPEPSTGSTGAGRTARITVTRTLDEGGIR